MAAALAAEDVDMLEDMNMISPLIPITAHAHVHAEYGRAAGERPLLEVRRGGSYGHSGQVDHICWHTHYLVCTLDGVPTYYQYIATRYRQIGKLRFLSGGVQLQDMEVSSMNLVYEDNFQGALVTAKNLLVAWLPHILPLPRRAREMQFDLTDPRKCKDVHSHYLSLEGDIRLAGVTSRLGGYRGPAALVHVGLDSLEIWDLAAMVKKKRFRLRRFDKLASAYRGGVLRLASYIDGGAYILALAKGPEGALPPCGSPDRTLTVWNTDDREHELHCVAMTTLRRTEGPPRWAVCDCQSLVAIAGDCNSIQVYSSKFVQWTEVVNIRFCAELTQHQLQIQSGRQLEMTWLKSAQGILAVSGCQSGETEDFVSLYRLVKTPTGHEMFLMTRMTVERPPHPSQAQGTNVPEPWTRNPLAVGTLKSPQEPFSEEVLLAGFGARLQVWHVLDQVTPEANPEVERRPLPADDGDFWFPRINFRIGEGPPVAESHSSYDSPFNDDRRDLRYDPEDEDEGSFLSYPWGANWRNNNWWDTWNNWDNWSNWNNDNNNWGNWNNANNGNNWNNGPIGNNWNNGNGGNARNNWNHWDGADAWDNQPHGNDWRAGQWNNRNGWDEREHWNHRPTWGNWNGDGGQYNGWNGGNNHWVDWDADSLTSSDAWTQ